METAWPLLLFFAFLFGSTLLVLIFGYYSREEEREERGTAELLENAGGLAIPRYFVQLGPNGSPEGFRALDEALLASIEAFLLREHSLAVELAGEPSLAGWHEAPRSAATSDEGLFERMERFVRAEQRLAAAFVREPSVESLYGRLQPALAG